MVEALFEKIKKLRTHPWVRIKKGVEEGGAKRDEYLKMD